MYERAQRGLATQSRDWVHVGRLFDPQEFAQPTFVTNGTSEQQIRNQFRAWLRYIAPASTQEAADARIQ